MDPVQSDLNLLGVKPVEPGVYNIHTPPLPKNGKKWTIFYLLKGHMYK